MRGQYNNQTKIKINQISEVILLAKDGSKRGGARPGAGRPRKALADKIADGNSGRPITVLPTAANLEGEDMPAIKEYLTEEQKIGIELEADIIYKYVWNWLKDWKCEKFISPEIIEHYALSAARHIQAEKLISRTGFLAKHPTTGAPIQSPYVAISHSYEKAANQYLFIIQQIIKENCAEEFKGYSDSDDMMAELLNYKRGG